MQTPTLASTPAKGRLTFFVVLQHLEGLALLGAALAVYQARGFGWLAFGLWLLAPDLSALGYLVNSRTGNLTYNLVHTLVFPLILGVAAVLLGNSLGLQAALIWLAHIGMDRALGYGLKTGERPQRARLA